MLYLGCKDLLDVYKTRTKIAHKNVNQGSESLFWPLILRMGHFMRSMLVLKKKYSNIPDFLRDVEELPLLFSIIKHQKAIF